MDGPRVLETVPAGPDADLALDVAAGIVGTALGVGLTVLRGVTGSQVLRSRALWRPAILPSRLQPATVVTELARLGARHRVIAAQQVQALVDAWTPVVVQQVLSRIDLTDLVLRHLDVDRVIDAADLDAAVARVDLDAAVARVDLDAVVGAVDLDGAVSRVDIEAILARIDLVAIVEEVIEEIDLPAIIRDSTGSMASETVRGARMTGIQVDEAISRTLERRLFRGRRTARADGD